jgi:hypothetical protein
MKIGATRFQ